jgi:parallel beta-helix repeat protein
VRAWGGNGHGIQSDVSYSTSADRPVGIVISGNVCELNEGVGIYAHYMNGGSISNNICLNNNDQGSGTGDGITGDEIWNLSITGNYCADTRSGGSRTQTNGINIIADLAINNIKNISITGNICYNNTANGIVVTNVAAETIAGVSIVGNECHDNGRGIFIVEATASTVTRITVSGNVCLSNTTVELRTSAIDVPLSGNIYLSQTSVIQSFTSTDATPSVKGRKVFKTATASATTSRCLMMGWRLRRSPSSSVMQTQRLTSPEQI